MSYNKMSHFPQENSIISFVSIIQSNFTSIRATMSEKSRQKDDTMTKWVIVFIVLVRLWPSVVGKS